MNMNVNTILTCVSAVIGHLLLISSSILTNGFDGRAKGCHDAKLGGCGPIDGITAAGSIAIIAAVVQIGFSYYAIMQKGGLAKKLWMPIHIALFVMIMISFIVALSYKGKFTQTTAMEFFYSMTGIDWIFCVLAVPAYHFLGNKDTGDLPT